jgi:hypothetical protein
MNGNSAAGIDILRDPNGAGLLIHGPAGPGRASVAESILEGLAESGFITVSICGRTDPDRLLAAVAGRMLAIAETENDDPNHPCRQLAAILRQDAHPWRHRFELLARTFLATAPTAVFLDDFEDNLADEGLDADTAALLARWLREPGRSRLLFAARHPFALPDDADADIALLSADG